jgi:hypothetical protein
MKCSKCGKEIANDSFFCEYCGTEIRNDNSNNLDNTKRVDIRWALLPAMFIATFAMWMRWVIYKADYQTDFLSLGILALISPTILFLISLFNWIKKIVPTSFFLIMACFLYLNCSMFIGFLDLSCKYIYKTEISWHDGHNVRRVELYDETWAFDEYDINFLRQNKREIIEALEKNGMDVTDGCYIDASECYYNSGGNQNIGELSFLLTSVLFILYLVYAIIAHKKGWKF